MRMPKSHRKSSFFKKDGQPNAAIVRRAANPKTLHLAQRLRSRPTRTEAIMWRKLYALSMRFRRQSVVLGWIADFYHPKTRLVIEIDGGYHAGQIAKDAHRDLVMQRHGFTVIRFTNDQVLKDADSVTRQIVNKVLTLSALTDARSARRSRDHSRDGRIERQTMKPDRPNMVTSGIR